MICTVFQTVLVGEIKENKMGGPRSTYSQSIYMICESEAALGVRGARVSVSRLVCYHKQ